MHRIADRAEAKLAPQEVAFVKAVLEGHRIEDAMVEFGFTGSAMASVFCKAIDHLQSYAKGLTGTQPASASPAVGGPQSDLETIHLAVNRLPGRSLAGLGARFVRRLLPSAGVFVQTLPKGKELFRALEAALESVERFARGEVVPSELADLAQVVEQLRDATPGLGKGDLSDRAYSCLFNACATLSLVLGTDESRSDLWTGFKSSINDFSHFTEVAADARLLLEPGIDLAEGPSKLGDALGVHRLGPLWPRGEPNWYREEVAQMSKTTEAQSSPVPEREVRAGDGVSPNNGILLWVQISPLAFLYSMAILFWTALRHPFTTSEVDLCTGRVVRQY